MMRSLRAGVVRRGIGAGLGRVPSILRIDPRGTRLPAVQPAAAASTASPVMALDHAALIPGFLRWIEHCNNGEAALAAGAFLPFEVDGQTVGYLAQDFAQHLAAFPAAFAVEPSAVRLAPSLRAADLDARSAAVGAAMAALRDVGVISGWRDELYPVLRSFGDPPVLLLERAAAPHFGIKAYGIHVNGYVRRHDAASGAEETLLWVARRAADKPTWPGKLDHIVAGGQPAGLSLAANVAKECQEEAGIPAALAAAAAPVGAVSYTALQPVGLKRDVLFCYDLELPADFVPEPQDGEVAEFFLAPLGEVAAAVAGGTPAPEDTAAYKDNCNLVVIDFLIRHGALAPDAPGYLGVLRALRSGDCS